MLPVGAYSYAMLALYISYVSPASPRRVVLYDGRCGWCQRSIRAARLLDWFRRVEWLDARDPAIARSLPRTRLEQLEAEMATVTPRGEVLWGFFAWRKVFGILPLTFLIWPLLYIPPVPQIGRKIYAGIAARRHRLGSQEACSLASSTAGEDADRTPQHILQSPERPASGRGVLKSPP